MMSLGLCRRRSKARFRYCSSRRSGINPKAAQDVLSKSWTEQPIRNGRVISLNLCHLRSGRAAKGEAAAPASKKVASRFQGRAEMPPKSAEDTLQVYQIPATPGQCRDRGARVCLRPGNPASHLPQRPSRARPARMTSGRVTGGAGEGQARPRSRPSPRLSLSIWSTNHQNLVVPRAGHRAGRTKRGDMGGAADIQEAPAAAEAAARKQTGH